MTDNPAATEARPATIQTQPAAKEQNIGSGDGNKTERGNRKALLAPQIEQGLQDPDRTRSALEAIAAGLVPIQSERGASLGFNLQTSIATLRQSENPLNVALGIDFEIAVARRELVATNYAIEINLKQGKITEEQAEEFRTKITDRINKLQQERETVVDEKGNKISSESQVTTIAEKFAENDEEQKQANEDPLGLIETKLNAALKNNQARKELMAKFQSIKQGMSEEEQAIVDEVVEGIFGVMDGSLKKEKIDKLKKVGNKALKIGGGAGALMLLMVWLATKEKQGAAMG